MVKRKSVVFLIGFLFLFLIANLQSYHFTLIHQKLSDNIPQIKSTAKYTYIAYICGDNNLEYYSKQDVNEMETGFNDSVTDVNVLVLLDLLNGGTTAYYISHDDQPSTITSTILTVDGLSSEENMGDPNTLIKFVNWCMTYYPAEHYVLDLWDHGSGWAICFDETSDDDALTMAELRTALAAINATTNNTIDILAMDACLMGTLEVAYEIRNYASILVASEDAILAAGFPYDDIIDYLCDNPSQNITQFASTIIDLFYNSMTFWSCTLSAINLTLVNDFLFPHFSSFAQNLYSYLDQGIKHELYTARGASQEFYYPEFIDLYDFAAETKKQASNFTIRQLAQALMDNITVTIINEKHRSNPDAHGLSIYYPEVQASYLSDYATSFSLSNDSLWDEFLEKYYTSANFGLGLRLYTINDTLGNNNDTPDPGETLQLEIFLENVGDIDATFVNGTLLCLDTENVTIFDALKSYGNISVSVSKTQSFSFNISSNCSKYQRLPFLIMTSALFNNYSVIRNFTFELIVGLKLTPGGPTFQEATEITPGYTYGILPGPGTNRESWLKINCSKNFYLFLNLTGPELTDFDAYIYDSTEHLVSVIGKATYPDECSFLLMQDDYYFIKLDPFSGSGYYTLFANFTTEPYEDGSFFGLAITLPGISSVNGSLPGPSANGYYYYRVIVSKNQQITVTLQGDSGTDFDIYIYNSELRQVASSRRPMTSSEYCFIYTDQDGYYYIVVVPYHGSGNFTLSVEVKDIPFPTWLIILLIFLLVLSVAVALAYYFFIIRKMRDIASADYDIYDIDL